MRPSGRPQDEPRRLQDCRRGAQDSPRLPQNRPKMGPRAGAGGFQRPPRGLRDPPQAPNTPPIPERPQKDPDEAPRTAQESCESRPEKAQRGSNRVFRLLTFSRFQPSKIEDFEKEFQDRPRFFKVELLLGGPTHPLTSGRYHASRLPGGTPKDRQPMTPPRSSQNVKNGPRRSQAVQNTLWTFLHVPRRPPTRPKRGPDDPTPLRGPANKNREAQTNNSAEQRRGTGKTWKSHNSSFCSSLAPDLLLHNRPQFRPPVTSQRRTQEASEGPKSLKT